MNKENYNHINMRVVKITLLVLMNLFFQLSFAQKVSSDDLLKQAIKETNINKNFNKAIILAKKGLAIDPDYTDIRLLLGRLCILTGRVTEAEAELNKVIIQKPSQKDALVYLVNLSYQQKDIPKSVMFSERYLKYYPNDKVMKIKRTAMLYEMGNDVKADAIWQSLRKQYPTDQQVINLYVDTHLKRANDYRKGNNTIKAIAEYEKIVALKTNHRESLNALYHLNMQLGNNERALYYANRVEKTGDQQLLMSKADLLRKMKRYDEALFIADKLKKSNPKNRSAGQLYKDILYAKAKDRLQKRDTVLAYRSYQKVLSSYPADTFSRNQLINLAVARSDEDAAIRYIDQGLGYYNNQQNIQLKKLSIIQEKGDDKQTYELSKSLTEKYPENEKMRNINDDLFTLTRQNRIGLAYGLTAFDQQGRNPWNLFSAYYMRTEKAGSIIGRVNYADRNDAHGYQFEVEAYPKHKKGYSYANVAYSNALIFPKFRLGYSYFLPVNKSWEAEFGARYLNSYFNYYSFTAGLSKSFGSIWLNAKTFVTPNGSRIANSYILSGRYLFNDSSEDYVTAIAGYGFSPDDRGRNFEITERLNLESIRLTLGYQRVLWKRNIAGIFSTWNNQEYLPQRKRNEFDLQISFQHKF